MCKLNIFGAEKLFFIVLAVMPLLALAPIKAQANTDAQKAMDIQKVTTPSGITAWLVESHSLPMVSLQVAFRAGSVFDPRGKNGVANLTAGMLTQGAGTLDAEAFQKQKERLGANISASASRLNITAGFDALRDVTDDTFALFAQMLRSPAFNKTDFKRLQKAVMASRKRLPERPRKLAREAFAEVVYGRYHPYSRPTEGTLRSLKKLQVDDVRAYHKKMFTKENMVVSVVGDITPKALSALLEKHLGDMPQGEKRQQVANAPKVQPPARQVIQKDIPQTTVMMGHKGLNRSAPDYFAALVTNHILGGGGFSSQLMQEVREKRGLVYGISSAFRPMPHWGAFTVAAQTKNETAEKVVDIVKKEIHKLRENGVSQEVYDAAISYLVGSFPLRLDSNGDILSYLTFMQTEQLGMDYMNDWVAKIKAVSRKDIRKAAQKRLKPDDMAVVLVGNPGASKQPKPSAPKPQTRPKPEAPKPIPEPTPMPQKKKKTAPAKNEPIKEEVVAAPVKKAPPQEAAKTPATSHGQKSAERKAPQPSRPQNPMDKRPRRNTESDDWL